VVRPRELAPFQDDQIGQIFAHWAIVYFGLFYEIAEVAQILGLLFSMVKVIHSV
jgi:hypothetical protein